MGWLFGCFHGRRERSEAHQKNKIIASARKALRKVTSRRDKAQVLPDTSVCSQEDQKPRDGAAFSKNTDADNRQPKIELVSREEERVNNETVAPINGSCQANEKENERSIRSRSDSSGSAAGISTVAGIHNDNFGKHSFKEESGCSAGYLNIEAVFPASLFTSSAAAADAKENLGADELLLNPQGASFCNHQRGSIFAAVENLRCSKCCEKSSPQLGIWEDDSSVCISSERSKSQLMSFDDKPIMGLIAAEWPDPDSEVQSYKAWDGKGFPNSTTKYKEDQLVSFQTTSFEARLERALATTNSLGV